MSGLGNSGSNTSQNQNHQTFSSIYREVHERSRSRSPRPLSSSSKERLRDRDNYRERTPRERSNKSKSLKQVPSQYAQQAQIQSTSSRPTAALLSLRPYPDYPPASSNSDTTKSSLSTMKYNMSGYLMSNLSMSTTPAGTNRSINQYNKSQHSVSVFDRSRNQRIHTEHAIRDRKIFSIIGVFPAIRRALIRRGWVEKGGPGKHVSGIGIPDITSIAQISARGSIDFASRAYDADSDSAWMTRILKGYSPDFIWAYKRDSIQWNALLEGQLINRHPNAFFTSKVGITACLHNFHWYSEFGVSHTFFPRCYRLCIDEEKAAFISDYRLCACMGLLKWIVGAYERDGDQGVLEPYGTPGVIPACVEFATHQINHYVRLRRHEDLDWSASPGVIGTHWEIFLNQYYNIVLLKMRLARTEEHEVAKPMYETAKRALQRLAPFWPQLNIDGTSDIWICKPGARSRGIGIILMNQLDKILSLLSQSNFRESNWVVQKYIERPMCVYNTKFDIRQWFIVADWSPLTVWFYKESYIRFCSKPFTLEDFHESIHLCNNAVQCRYKNSSFRDSALPEDNMWDNYTFQAYLKTLGKMNLWDSVIYPGMKQGILGVLLASQENVIPRKGCFELYGADFMLCEDFHPWLIEINSSPCMSSTTHVTARMCPQCLEDLVKVMVDRRDDKNANTGLFELAYKQAETRGPNNLAFQGGEMVIQGKKLHKDVDWPSLGAKVTKYKSKKSVNSSKGGGSSQVPPSSEKVPVGSEVGAGTTVTGTVGPRPGGAPSGLSMSIANGQTFMNLIQRLRLKDAQRKSPVDSAPGTSAAPTPKKSASKYDQQRGSFSNKGKTKQSHKRQQNLQTLAAAHQQLQQVSQNRQNSQSQQDKENSSTTKESDKVDRDRDEGNQNQSVRNNITNNKLDTGNNENLELDKVNPNRLGPVQETNENDQGQGQQNT